LASKGVLLALLALCLVACGDDETEATETCRDYANVSASPSFATEVMPVFAISCALSASCHQAPNGAESPKLGPAMSTTPSQADIDAVHAELVGAASQSSSLPLVAAGDPAGSWLLAKLTFDDFASCEEQTQCDACGDRMPPSSSLEQDRIDIIAAWIKDGAQNN